MVKSIAVVLAAGAILSFGVAQAAETAGKVQSVNTGERIVTLEDGTQLFVAEGVPMDSLKEGATVKATYEEQDGKKVVTQLEISD
jgi:Cu/Ag efflux protein CusF